MQTVKSISAFRKSHFYRYGPSIFIIGPVIFPHRAVYFWSRQLFNCYVFSTETTTFQLHVDLVNCLKLLASYNLYMLKHWLYTQVNIVIGSIVRLYLQYGFLPPGQGSVVFKRQSLPLKFFFQSLSTQNYVKMTKVNHRSPFAHYAYALFHSMSFRKYIKSRGFVTFQRD